jgi:hypothetical protein
MGVDRLFPDAAFPMPVRGSFPSPWPVTESSSLTKILKSIHFLKSNKVRSHETLIHPRCIGILARRLRGNIHLRRRWLRLPAGLPLSGSLHAVSLAGSVPVRALSVLFVHSPMARLFLLPAPDAHPAAYPATVSLAGVSQKPTPPRRPKASIRAAALQQRKASRPEE